MSGPFRIFASDRNFLGVETVGGWDDARFVVLPVPLELTTTYLKGTAKGPGALLEASHQVELYDDELRVETYRAGIATLAPVAFSTDDPKEAVSEIEIRVAEILDAGKRLVVVGGEHTVTVGAVRAFRKTYPELSVLHLDGHADLREAYEGSAYSHACVMARVGELCPFVSVGVRSLCAEEAALIQEKSLKVYDIHRMRRDAGWMGASLNDLGDELYITLDLDVFDPSVVPSVGTPEPGGMGWVEVLTYLKEVFRRKRVVGMDVVELAPRPGTEHGVFATAKLLYRLMGYWHAFGR